MRHHGISSQQSQIKDEIKNACALLCMSCGDQAPETWRLASMKAESDQEREARRMKARKPRLAHVTVVSQEKRTCLETNDNKCTNGVRCECADMHLK